mmetsp:Transcript_14136/g.37958  ORF Transcript_14136/g.37958 Transcript_14136/m.37958 type:complete len:141 (-) Transcript_14136:1580-2002(-)
MGVHCLFVVNKAGGLVFQRTYSERAPQLSQNDYLHLASTFHGLQLLVRELSPNGVNAATHGIERMESSTFTLHAMSTATGTQLFVTCDCGTERMREFLADVYSSYSDYVMKNPFYEIDMPIRNEVWDAHLRIVVEKYNKM